jgi:hypothetical protein
MHTTVIGLFDSYGQAEAAVLDLELTGIVGEAVEVISDVDRDETAVSLGKKPRESFRDRVAHVFGRSEAPAANQVHDTPGDMPDYIGEQEFYATHVRDEGAVMVVRVANDDLAEVAGAILKKHGSKTRDGKDGVTTREEDGRPHSPSGGHRNL